MFDEFDRLDEKPNKEIDTSYVAFTEEDYQELQRNLVLYKQGNAEAVTYIVNTFHRFINKYARFITYGSLPYIPYTDSKGNKRHKVDPSVSRFVALFIDKNTSAGQDKKKCFSNTCTKINTLFSKYVQRRIIILFKIILCEIMRHSRFCNSRNRSKPAFRTH